MKYNIKQFCCLALVAVMSLSSAASHADEGSDKALLEGAKLCTRYLPRHEREFGIPVHLLAAIATTESGRYHKGLGISLPWPWTINVEGKGYYFDNKEEAVAAVQKLQSRGFQSIDVGCMQVNLHHHPRAFASVEQAFEPAYNVAYAAQFLKQNFLDEKSWRKAIADYHSRTPAFGNQYAKQVTDAWGRIIAKVEDAHAGRPLTHATARQFAFNDDAVSSRSASRSKTFHSGKMHSLSVKDSNDDVQVVSRDYQPKASVQASAAESSDDFVSRHMKSPPVNAQAAVKAQTTEPVKPTAVITVADARDSKAPQIVGIEKNDTIKTRGQYQPRSHVIRITTPSDTVKSPANMFVFDN